MTSGFIATLIRRSRRAFEAACGASDDAVAVERPSSGSAARGASRGSGGSRNGRQIDGSGTVLGRSMVWPNQFFWIFAIVPSPRA